MSSPYIDFNTHANDWLYFNRLLTGQCIHNRYETKTYCYALVGNPDYPRDYTWWRLRKKDYKLQKQTQTTKWE